MTEDLPSDKCSSFEDFYTPKSRQTIGKLLSVPLRDWKLTPIELVHSEEGLLKVHTCGDLLQKVIQKIAIVQVQGTNKKVSKRILELFDLANTLRIDIKTTFNADMIPLIEGNDLDGILKRINKFADPSKALTVAITRSIADLPNRETKFQKILSFLKEGESPLIRKVLDNFLVDFFELPNTLKDILGPSENLGESLLKILNFLQGDINKAGLDNPEEVFLCGQLANGLLPQARTTIINRVLNVIGGSIPFDQNNLLNNFHFNTKILDAFSALSEKGIGKSVILDLMDTRCERALNDHTVMVAVLDLKTPWDKVNHLLDINEGVIGEVNNRFIANHIISILDSPSNAENFITNEYPIPIRLEILKRLQEKALEANFTSYYCDKISEYIDAICFKLLQEHKVLKNLEGKKSESFSKTQSILKLFSKERVTKGQASSYVLNSIRALMEKNDFMKGLTKTSQGDYDDQMLVRSFHKELMRLTTNWGDF